jgi:hypothetical protein
MAGKKSIPTPADPQLKHCRGCDRDLPRARSSFYGHPLSYDRLDTRCKQCTAARTAADKRARPDYYRQKKLRAILRKRGSSIEEYDRLFVEQGGVCAICGRPELRRRLSVDHCHVAGVVRGLLCSDCNVMIGLARDDVSLLRRAIAYLEAHNARAL